MARDVPSAGSGSRAERLPPHSEEAERGVLGCVLLAADRAMDLCVERQLIAESFYIPAHRIVFDTMLGMLQAGKPIDILTVSNALRDAGNLDKIEGPGYLDRLIDSTPTAAHAEYYIDIVRQKFLLRCIIGRARDAEAACYRAEESADEILGRVEQSFFDITEQQHGSITPWPKIVEGVMTDVEHLLTAKDGLTGLATGFRNLDENLMGLRPGNLIILAARPSMGKTSLAMNVAANIATGHGVPGHQVKPVGAFSLEMSKEELVMRMLCTRAEVSMFQISGGLVASKGNEHRKLVNAAAELRRAPIFLDDTPALEISELRARARRMKKKHDVSLMVVDYLQLIRASEFSRQSRQVEISAVSGGLKAMAKELHIPVLVLSQLSRATETRDRTGKPRLSDLRESGSIEQDADVVLLLRRPCRYEDDEKSADKRLAIVDIAKHRNGPARDDVHFNFIEEYTLFEDRVDVRDGGDGAVPPEAREEAEQHR